MTVEAVVELVLRERETESVNLSQKWISLGHNV